MSNAKISLKSKSRESSFFNRSLDFLCITKVGFVIIVIYAILPFVPPFNREYIIRWFILATITGAAAMAFDLSAGYIAVINFGFMGFFGLGAYTSAIFAIRLGLSPWITIFIGIVPSAILGFISGLLSLKLRGMMVLCFTWFIGLALLGLATKMVDLTRGALGLSCPTLFQSTSNIPYFYTALLMLIIAYVVLKRIVRSKMGLAFRAIGQNMEAARTSGIKPIRYRLINFTVSCAVAGWVGGFYAHYYGVLTPDLMSTAKTTEILVIAYIGGRQSLWGGAVVAIPFLFLMEVLRSTFSNLPGVNLIIYGIILILVMLFYPGGLAQFYGILTDKVRELFSKSSDGKGENGKDLYVLNRKGR